MTESERELLIMLGTIARDSHHKVRREDISGLMDRIELDAVESTRRIEWPKDIPVPFFHSVGELYYLDKAWLILQADRTEVAMRTLAAKSIEGNKP
jgi:hypothetical protein